MINVGRVLNNPRFQQTFTAYRKSGSWVSGRWNGTENTLSIQGVVTVASQLDLQQIPEGDRQTGAMVFHANQPLYLTSSQGTSDELEWRGSRWRVMQVSPYADYGYYKAIATKMDPSSGVSP